MFATPEQGNVTVKYLSLSFLVRIPNTHAKHQQCLA